MNSTNREALQERLARIIERMQFIQRAIKSSGQPASPGELAELARLGNEYAVIVEQLADIPDNAGLA